MQLEWIQFGNRRHRQHAEENFLYKRAQNSPPLLPPVFGNLRGTPQTRTLMQLKPKARKSVGKGQHSQPEEIFSVVSWACSALLSQPRGGNLEFPTLGYCTWQNVGSYKTALSQIQGFLPHSSEPPLPSSTASICPRRAR